MINVVRLNCAKTLNLILYLMKQNESTGYSLPALSEEKVQAKQVMLYNITKMLRAFIWVSRHTHTHTQSNHCIPVQSFIALFIYFHRYAANYGKDEVYEGGERS
jgi:hypothetical protein